MSFFTNKKEFTHYGRLNGIPIYIRDLESDGPVIAGQNVLFDWLLLNIVPWVNGLVETIHCAVDPDWEPCWAIEVRGKL